MTDWHLIREAYEGTDETVASICERFGMKPTILYRRCAREGWTMRRPPTPPPAGAAKPLPPAQMAKTKVKALPKARLIERLYKAFDRQMKDFESRMAQLGHKADGEIGAAANEKDARTLGTLARTLEKLIELRAEDAAAGPESNKGADIDSLREELARRIERVCPEGPAQ